MSKFSHLSFRNLNCRRRRRRYVRTLGQPDNILIDEHDNIRLADFGLARVLDTTTRERALTICGTDGFIAPEVMLGMNYSPQCDVFSYGMVLAQV